MHGEHGLSHSLASGLAIPAHPLALTAQGQLDSRSQRALTRYYLDAEVGGLAVGVHTTQFTIREHGLFRPVLELAAHEAFTWRPEARSTPVVMIAGVCGPVEQAVREAETAATIGYQAVLVSPSGLAHLDEATLLERSAAVGEVLPVIGFYLQAAVGGRDLSREYWRALADQPSTVAVKIAPFDRYRTLTALGGIEDSDRRDEVAAYTGNDDHIIGDLLGDFPGHDGRTRHMVGGLLGQFAVWTSVATAIVSLARAARAGDGVARDSLLHMAEPLTDANAALFDATNRFRGCNAGVLEVLRRQGLVRSGRLLDPNEALSPGQAAELDRVAAHYPELIDDEFVAENIDRWRDS